MRTFNSTICNRSILLFLSIGLLHICLGTEETTQYNSNVTVDPLMQPVPLLISTDSLCTTDTGVIIAVHSNEGNFVRRDLIRQTYGGKKWKEKFGFEVLFVVGRSPNFFYDKWLREEAEKYGDILQGDFYENYHNMTVKAMVWLRYTAKYCTWSTFVMHLDDDIVIDLFSIMRNFFGREEIPDENTIYCLADSYVEGRVVRDKGNSWYVPESVYPSPHYPIYCAGAAYVIPTAVLPSLIENLEKKPYLPIDDALITGIARDECGVDIEQVMPKAFLRKSPHCVIEEFHERKIVVAECTERCSVDAWQLILSHRLNHTPLVSLSIESLPPRECHLLRIILLILLVPFLILLHRIFRLRRVLLRKLQKFLDDYFGVEINIRTSQTRHV